jgi:hypothetical protein
VKRRGLRLTPFVVLMSALALGLVVTILADSAEWGEGATTAALCAGVILFGRGR